MTAEDLRKSILQQAIQGKLVPQDPTDEPASILLARIREEKARLIKEKKIKKDKNESLIYRGDDNSYYEKFADGTVKCIDEEMPFEIPQGWEWCRLGYLFQHNTGKALNAANTAGTAKKYLTTSNVYWDQFDFAAVKEMPFTDEEIGKCTIKKGDLLVCEGGDIGRAAIWHYDYDICIQNHIHRLRGYVELCTYYFYNIFWLYKRSGIIGGKGIGIQGLSAGALHNILVPLPPLCEQYRIVEALDKYANLLNLYDDYKTKLDEMEDAFLPSLKKSILQYAIQGKLVHQNPEDEPASELLKRIEEEKARLVKTGKIKRDKNASVIFKGEDNKYYEKLGTDLKCIDEDLPFEIPSTWAWTRVTSVTYPVGNKDNQIFAAQIQKKGTIPVVSQGQNIIDGYCECKEKVVDDLPLIMFGDHTRNVKFIDFPFVIGADGTKFHKSICINPYYLYYWMMIIAEQLKDRGYARHYSLLKQEFIPLPPLREQDCIVLSINGILKSIEGV